jgi:hypothetical protein
MTSLPVTRSRSLSQDSVGSEGGNRRVNTQALPTECNADSPDRVGEDGAVADAHEAGREDVQQEAAEEDLGGQAQALAPIAVGASLSGR